MEARVLMPRELALACVGSSVYVCAQRHVKPGTVFQPDQGSIRLGRLPSADNSSNMQKVGSYDEIIKDSTGRNVRRCNWVRFLRSCDEIATKANIRVIPGVDGRPQFEVIKHLTPRVPLVSTSLEYFNAQDCSISVSTALQESPLDLSQKLVIEKNLEEPVQPLLQTADEPRRQMTLRVRGQQRALLPCDVCGKAFDRPSLLKRHMRTHTGERPHACSVCEKRFSTSSSLNTHRRIHSGEKPHQCGVCGKRFTASSNLYYHRMTHTKDKPHKCELCLKSFPTPGDLRSHQYVHSGAWPFRCGACGRGFSKQTNLRNHLFLHTGDKPHSCSICGKRFALACNLRAHVKTHEEENEVVSSSKSHISSLMLDTAEKLASPKFSPWDFCASSQQVDMAKVAALWSSSHLPGLTVESLHQRAGLMLEAQILLGTLQPRQ